MTPPEQLPTPARPGLPRRIIVAGVVGVVILLSGLGLTVWVSDLASDAEQDHRRIRALEEQNDERGDDLDRLGESLDAANAQLQALGVEPVTAPADVIVGQRGETGPGPSDEQVAAAVARYCQTNGCTGPQGPEPSPIQVAAAVAAYCDDRGQCTGPPGAEGSTGAQGPAGESITGPQGPGPTGEQIAAAVESYCAERNGCAGPPGADGEDSTVPGPPGAPGPACPEGAGPIPWPVDQAQSLVIGLPPDTYLICRADP